MCIILVILYNRTKKVMMVSVFLFGWVGVLAMFVLGASLVGFSRMFFILIVFYKLLLIR